MTTRRPISIFGLQTEEERARTELLSEVLEHFRAEEPKGEIVVVVGGAVVEKGEHKNKYKE